jgi:hypothetical protein
MTTRRALSELVAYASHYHFNHLRFSGCQPLCSAPLFTNECPSSWRTFRCATKRYWKVTGSAQFRSARHPTPIRKFANTISKSYAPMWFMAVDGPNTPSENQFSGIDQLFRLNSIAQNTASRAGEKSRSEVSLQNGVVRQDGHRGKLAELVHKQPITTAWFRCELSSRGLVR